MQKRHLSILSLTVSLLLLTACGSSTKDDDAKGTSGSLKIIGKIEYERVQAIHSANISRLDSTNITTESAKQIVVEAINRSGEVIASTTTDDNGAYSLTNLPENTYLKIRAYAKMLKKDKWDTKVIDNTNGGAEYVLEGSLVSTKTQSTRRNLKALASTKQSPPFAILDSIYQAIKKVDRSDSNIVFPPLNLNWSVNNVPAGGSIADGQIQTTLFDGENNIYVLGDQQGDTDEYDDHIMIHEWGHYFEAKFSRADSIGGSHQAGDYSDIRLAFGEGWGNALSAIITDNPIYFDTSGGSGWNMNIESATQVEPGWFSEASIQRILYDLYDSNDDGSDQLSLGFKPLYNTLIGFQKTTPAFTSLFSFVTGLKAENSNKSDKIDAIIASEGIATINDIYGENRRTSNVISETLPIYHKLNINQAIDNICITNHYGTTYPVGQSMPNKLNTHTYINFTINNSKEYTINVQQTNGTDSDPDFVLFKSSPFKKFLYRDGSAKGVESVTKTLPEGQYLLDILNATQTTKACFSVSVNG